MEKGESNPTDFNQTANAGIQRMGVRLRWMGEGESNPTDSNQTPNAGSQRMGVRLRAPRFVVKRETARTGN